MSLGMGKDRGLELDDREGREDRPIFMSKFVDNVLGKSESKDRAGCLSRVPMLGQCNGGERLTSECRESLPVWPNIS